MPRQAGIGRAELEILRYITDHYPLTVREVAEHLARTKGHTRTTALNIMERLREKGYLEREKVEGVYVYSPIQPKAQLMRGLVRDFVEQMLGGSLDPLVAYLTHDARISDEQLEDLKQVVRALDQQQKEGEP